MKYALVSDIHANLEAFTACLKVIEEERCEKIICLGDIVGYGANPRECIKLVREYGMATIAGNHDFACIGKTNINYFNSYAKESTLWTLKVTTESDKEYLNSLPLVDYHDDFTVVHGTLYSPELFDYIQTTEDADPSLDIMPLPVCFVGHTHVPGVFLEGPDFYSPDELDYRFEVTDEKAVINVGSVGQPRDRDPRSSFVVVNERQVEFVRLPYDVDTTVKKVEKIDELDNFLGTRLLDGR